MQDVSGMFHKREIGVRNDTYTRAEIDAKDGTIQAAADKAQATADGAVEVNNTQNTQISALQKSAHSHSNKDVLDKIEQPYTTAERDKLSGLENYVHPAHTAYNKGMYKVAVDDEGHVTEAETMTKEDIYNAGGVIQSELTFQDYIGDIPLAFMTLFYGGGLRNIAEIGFDRRDDDGKRNFSLKLGGWQDKSTGRLDLIEYIGCQYTITPDPNNSYGTQHYYYVLPAGKSGTIALTSDIPDISEKQDKLTAGTNITISGNTISAKDTTYGNASASAAGLMTAADKKKLDGIAAGATKVAVDSALSATSTNPVQNKAVKAALDSKSASGHTHAMITNSALLVSGANNTAKWVKLGTLVSSGNFSNAMIRVWSGDGANGRANQNSSFEVQIKDGWQSTESATKACGVTVYRVDCSSVKVKVIPTAHDTYTAWVYLPWTYWNGNYAVYGKYKSWTPQPLIQSDEPEGTGADTAYYDQAFLTSTVAAAQTLVDSGWQVPTFPSGISQSSIRYRKQGKIVSVTGYVKFSASMAAKTVLTLPEGYRPPKKIQQFNAVDSYSQASFLTVIDTDGSVRFSGKTQGFFDTTSEYHIHCTFFVD